MSIQPQYLSDFDDRTANTYASLRSAGAKNAFLSDDLQIRRVQFAPIGDLVRFSTFSVTLDTALKIMDLICQDEYQGEKP